MYVVSDVQTYDLFCSVENCFNIRDLVNLFVCINEQKFDNSPGINLALRERFLVSQGMTRYTWFWAAVNVDRIGVHSLIKLYKDLKKILILKLILSSSFFFLQMKMDQFVLSMYHRIFIICCLNCSRTR